MEYKTIKDERIYEESEKRSRFISYSFKISSSDEAYKKLRKVKSIHKNAKHWVYAFILKNGIEEKYCDDGEPSGTGGIPILGVIKSFNLQRVMVIVVRYFGGVLLGTTLLRKKYISGARGVLTESGIKLYTMVSEFSVECNYIEYEKILTMIYKSKGRVLELRCSENVLINFCVKKELSEVILKKLESIMHGNNGIKALTERYETI